MAVVHRHLSGLLKVRPAVLSIHQYQQPLALRNLLIAIMILSIVLVNTSLMLNHQLCITQENERIYDAQMRGSVPRYELDAAVALLTEDADTDADVEERQPSSSNSALRGELLNVDAERVWESLLTFGKEISMLSSHPLQGYNAVLEVGMHRATQCMQAASAGFEAYCVEPSPTSFSRIQRSVATASDDVQNRIHLFHAAAGSSSNETVPFTSMGGTGDHVGHSNVWTMNTTDVDARASVIYVPTLRLDDIVLDKHVFLAKIDTQGYEPAVFSGLKEALKQHRIAYVLTEYWPRGMDFTMNEAERSCIAARVLQDLTNSGYTLYAMNVMSHPRAPMTFKQRPADQRQPPLHNLLENCQWYYELEIKHPDPSYSMGYWSDILATAPGFDLPPSLLAKTVGRGRT